MSVRQRLHALERQLAEAPAALTDTDREGRIAGLLTYRGTDAARLARQRRVLEIFAGVRDRLNRQGHWSSTR